MAKNSAVPEPDPNKILKVRESDYGGKSRERIMAEIAQSPVAANAATTAIFSVGTFGEIGITDSLDALREKAAKVQRGNMADMEALLVAQATALDAIFNEMARRAALNMGEYIKAADTYLRLALKAQSQCRTTMETLAEIKNPRQATFIKQANVAHGHQQINNGTPAADTLAHEEKPIQSNELSGESHELLPDDRASQAASRIDTPLEAVAEINRAAN